MWFLVSGPNLSSRFLYSFRSWLCVMGECRLSEGMVGSWSLFMFFSKTSCVTSLNSSEFLLKQKLRHLPWPCRTLDLKTVTNLQFDSWCYYSSAIRFQTLTECILSLTTIGFRYFLEPMHYFLKFHYHYSVTYLISNGETTVTDKSNVWNMLSIYKKNDIWSISFVLIVANISYKKY